VLRYSFVIRASSFVIPPRVQFASQKKSVAASGFILTEHCDFGFNARISVVSKGGRWRLMDRFNRHSLLAP
jgi:hypothetical protein